MTFVIFFISRNGTNVVVVSTNRSQALILGTSRQLHSLSKLCFCTLHNGRCVFWYLESFLRIASEAKEKVGLPGTYSPKLMRNGRNPMHCPPEAALVLQSCKMICPAERICIYVVRLLTWLHSRAFEGIFCSTGNAIWIRSSPQDIRK